MNVKYFPYKLLVPMSGEFKRQNKRVALITGCFDIVHHGHVELFNFARKNADILIVGLESDRSVKLLKGSHRPILTFEKRLKMLESLAGIDYLFKVKSVRDFSLPSTDKLYGSLVTELNVDMTVTSPRADKYWRQRAERANRLHCVCLFYNKVHRVSTSQIINKLYSI